MMRSAPIVDSRRWRRPSPVPTHVRVAGESISLRLCQYCDDAVIDLSGSAEHTVSFVVGRTVVVEYRDGGRRVRETYQPREGWLIPAGVPMSFALVGGGVIAYLRLSAAWFAEAAAEEFGLQADRITLRERPRLQDSFLWVLVAGLLRRNRILPALDPLVRDALALGLACYLIRVHSSTAVALARTTGRDDRALVSDFLDDVVGWELGLGELAQVIGVAAGELMACFSDADAERLQIHVERARVHVHGAHIPGSDASPPEFAQPLSHAGGRLRLVSPTGGDVASYFVFGCPAAECRPFLPLLRPESTSADTHSSG
jgi:hypothetical protein